jgi:hypothetical protein
MIRAAHTPLPTRNLNDAMMLQLRKPSSDAVAFVWKETVKSKQEQVIRTERDTLLDSQYGLEGSHDVQVTVTQVKTELDGLIHRFAFFCGFNA